MSDLDKLIEAVKAGEWPGDFLAADSRTSLRIVTTASLYAAFSGSLDAAKALHDALLPEWWAMLRHSTRPMTTVGDIEVLAEAQDDILARAWLLAVLKALQARGAA